MRGAGGKRCALAPAETAGARARALVRAALLTGTKLIFPPAEVRRSRELDRESCRAALGWAVGSARESRSMRTSGTRPYGTAASSGVSPPGSTAALKDSRRAP